MQQRPKTHNTIKCANIAKGARHTHAQTIIPADTRANKRTLFVLWLFRCQDFTPLQRPLKGGLGIHFIDLEPAGWLAGKLTALMGNTVGFPPAFKKTAVITRISAKTMNVTYATKKTENLKRKCLMREGLALKPKKSLCEPGSNTEQ